MTKEQASAALYQKMAAAQEQYRNWLLSQPPEEILNHAYEYSLREDILYSLENEALESGKAEALLRSPDPLSEIVRDWENQDHGYMEDLRQTMENRAAQSFLQGLLPEMAKGMDDDQIQQIRWGVENELPLELVRLYADPKFSAAQMAQIRFGLEDGLAPEQIALYAKPEFEAKQMNEILQGLNDGLPEEQVRLYAKPEFDKRQMRWIWTGLEQGLSVEQVRLYAKPEYAYLQMREICLGLLEGKPPEEIPELRQHDAPAPEPEDGYELEL